MRRSITWITIPLMAVGLTACGSGDPSEPETTTTTSTASSQTTTTHDSTTTTTSSGEPTTTAAEPTTSTSSAPSSSSTSDGDATGGRATEIATVWVDDSWTVEQVKEDLCEMGGLTESSFSEQDELFTCGPTAANVKACTYEDGGKTTCITDPRGQMAIRFTSPTVDNWDGQMRERDTGPIPMYVELEDGVKCSVLSHDHGKHWNNRFSWYGCEDDSELLTKETIEGTFDDDSDAWTVQRSVDGSKPTQTAVTRAVYAGTG